MNLWYLARRLEHLERLLLEDSQRRLQSSKPPSIPPLEVILEEERALDAWLQARGLTAEDAMDRHETGPPGLRHVTLAHLVRARRAAQEWRAALIRGEL